MSDCRFAYILFALLSFMASLHLNLLKVAAPLHRQTEASATPSVLSTFFVNGLKSATNNYFIRSPLGVLRKSISLHPLLLPFITRGGCSRRLIPAGIWAFYLQAWTAMFCKTKVVWTNYFLNQRSKNISLWKVSVNV